MISFVQNITFEKRINNPLCAPRIRFSLSANFAFDAALIFVKFTKAKIVNKTKVLLKEEKLRSEIWNRFQP